MKNPKVIILILMFATLGKSSNADMTAITVAASVRAFDTKTVTLQVNKKRVLIPRKMVEQSELHTGDAIMVTFRGANIHYLFGATESSGDSLRNPASEKHTR